jgi:protein TonB
MFDRYVAAKKRKRPLLYAAFVGSSVLMAATIVGFVIYSFIHVEEVQPPPLTVQFVATAPPPPPPPPPPKAAVKKQVTPKTPPKPVVQPITTPQAITQPKEPEKPEEPDTGGEGVPGGVEGGVAGGVVGAAPAPAAPPPPPPPKPKIVPAILIKKDALYKPDPHLPDVVKAQRRGSMVTGSYKLCIAQTGAISSVEVVNSIPGADEPIMATLREWKYKPQAIPICFILYLEFQVE